MKRELITAVLFMLFFNVYSESLSNTINAAYNPVAVEINSAVYSTPTADTAIQVTSAVQISGAMPEELCGGLLYAGVDMWTGYSIFTVKNSIESAVKKEELKSLLSDDEKSKKYYEDADFKKIFSMSFSILAAASAAYLIIESGFFESGLIRGGRPAALIASGAAVPLFIFASDWAGKEAFNDINRAVNVYNTNISCGMKK